MGTVERAHVYQAWAECPEAPRFAGQGRGGAGSPQPLSASTVTEQGPSPLFFPSTRANRLFLEKGQILSQASRAKF